MAVSPAVSVPAAPLKAAEVFEILRAEVLGQDEALRSVALAVHKHTIGAVPGNLLLVGSSGTGKTTIMRAIHRLFRRVPQYSCFRAMAVINANLLIDPERLEFRPERLLAAIEQRARAEIGHVPSAEELSGAMQHATVCIDEIDKMSTRLGGRPNPVGIALQQGLLTLLEGCLVPFSCRVRVGEREEVRVLEVDTARMMFICGGAFEGLYDQVFARVSAPGSGEKIKPTMVRSADGQLRFESRFSLKEFFRAEDLFDYGMVPQLTARFDSVLMLSDLSTPVLTRILLDSPDSPFARSKRYLAAMGIDLELDPAAAALVAEHAERSTRMGARALRAAFSKISAPLEFDPWGSGVLEAGNSGRLKLVIDAEMAKGAFETTASAR